MGDIFGNMGSLAGGAITQANQMSQGLGGGIANVLKGFDWKKIFGVGGGGAGGGGLFGGSPGGWSGE
jgi:hypothetical protein